MKKVSNQKNVQSLKKFLNHNFIFKSEKMTLFLLLAVLAHTVLSSAYFNNEYFPYITAKEVVELWNKKVTLDYVSDKSFSCEAVHL